MKKVFLSCLLCLSIFTSCVNKSRRPQKIKYCLMVKFQNGESDTIVCEAYRKPFLDEGDLCIPLGWGYEVVASGVAYFKEMK